MSDLSATAGSLCDEPPPTSQTEEVYVMPCSYAQQRLWFLEQWESGGALYNVPMAVRLEGALNEAALQQALAALVLRHESLRTAFVLQDGEPFQHIVPDAAVQMQLQDLSGHEPAQAQSQALDLAEQFAQRPFDLSLAPLLRALLIRIAAQEHLLVLVLHHIVSDGWSMGVLFGELSALYQAQLEGRQAQLPALSIQYADYALWQRERLQGQLLEQELGYWRKRLEGLSNLELPTERPRPPTPSYRGASQPVFIQAQLSETLKRLGRTQQCTLFMTLLAAFAVLLQRYSGQSDIAVGSPIAGRNHSQLEGLIGFFVNTLVLRTDASGNPSFLELLARVRESALDAYAHQELPFEKLVEELKPQRDPSRNPLVQVMFALQNAPGAELSLPGVRCSRVKLSTDTAKFDLTLSLSEHADGLRGQLEYATDLFESDTLARMAEHLRVLLEAIVADPTQPISQLPLLTAVERAQMLVQWNDTATEYPRDLCVHQLIEAQVNRNPKATAVCFGEQQLSYQELNRRANQLAHHLRTLGVGPEVRVGICVERSLELVVALLGILKAGGAYVPLDPGYPKQRLAFMLEDAQPAVLLTHSQLLQALPQHTAACLCLDRDWPSIAAQPDTNPISLARPDNLAYLIYTSGSTGIPKGVAVAHRALCNHMAWMLTAFQFTSADRVLQKTPISADASVWEFFAPLQAGTLLVMAPPGAHRDVAQLIDVVARYRISVLQLVPSLLHLFVHDPDCRRCTSLRLVFAGGEALSRVTMQQARHVLTAVVCNLYGPTEACIDATCWVDGGSPIDEEAPSIGRPIANTRAYVLDPWMQPVPIGVPGELYLGGDGLARGYWNRPELTAEKFVANPFSTAPGARLYRTGDHVRWRRDGSLEFLGRIDHQVKIRGFRIEPGEIEALLAQQPGVQQALVMVHEDIPGDKRLVAYVVGASVQPDALRQYLREHLPEYMLPSAIVPLTAWPLTPNGKVDRGKLPAPRINSGKTPQSRIAPRTSIELHLSKIWEDLLGSSEIGVTDSFFDLGGHSLLALRLMDRIEKTFGQRLPLDTLWFHATTIAALADLLRDGRHAAISPDLVHIKDGSRRPLFVVHTMGGNLFHYYDLARQLEADQAVLGLQARGVYGDGAPDRSIPMTAARCIEAMRRAQPKGPYLVAGFSSGGLVAYEIAQQLSANRDKVAMLGLLDSFAPHAKTRGAWVRRLKPSPGRSVARQLQERLYFYCLYPFGLGHLRNLRTTGEAHRWAHWSYRPRPYVSPIDLFVTEGSESICLEPALGWQRVGVGQLRIHRLPGSHTTLFKRPVVVQLARKLQACLDVAGKD